MAGLSIFLYPYAAAWVSQLHQSELIVDVTSEQKHSDPVALDEELQRARDYNSLLVGGALIGANAHKPTAQVEQVGNFDYHTLLEATPDGVMGRLRIPSINVDLPIYHGTDDVTLTRGVGHLEGTSLPVGGTSQHSVLTAHRGLPSATLFNDLDKVRIGDTFTLTVFGEVLTYKVRDTRVVEPEDTDTLRVVAGEDLVTLVTCTPLGINTHRILVTGERVLPTPSDDVAAASEKPNIPGFPWWIISASAGIIVICVYMYTSGRPAKPKGKRG